MFRLLYLPFAVAVATLVLLLAPTAVHAQSFDQTLPPGYMNTDGLWPTGSFNGTDDITEVWYYDASLFSASGPILINEIFDDDDHWNQSRMTVSVE